MKIEWKMDAVDCDIPFHRFCQAPINRSGHGRNSAPKHSMVNHQKINAPVDRQFERTGTSINCRPDLSDNPFILQLKSVNRARVVLDFCDLEQFVGERYDVLESDPLLIHQFSVDSSPSRPPHSSSAFGKICPA